MSTEDLSIMNNVDVTRSNVSSHSSEDWLGWGSQEKLNVSLTDTNSTLEHTKDHVDQVGPNLNSNETFQDQLMKMLQDINCKLQDVNEKVDTRFEKMEANMNQKFEQVNLQFENINARLDKHEERMNKLEEGFESNKVEVNDRLNNMQSNNDKLDNKLQQVCESIDTLELSVNSNQRTINNVKQQCEATRSESRGVIDECVKKQGQFEERYNQEAIVVNSKIKSLESDNRSFEVRLVEIETEVSENRQKTQPTYIVSQEVKSTSTISANAELFLTRFNNEHGTVHPMIYLKFARKFVDVSGDNWEVQLLHLIKYLKGEPEIWARQHVDKFDSFVQFESEFKKKYWGNVRQREFECDLMSRGNLKTSKLDLQTYIMNYYEINKMLDKPISMEMFLKHICRHLPESSAAAVQMIMTVREIETENELEVMCRNLSSIHDKESLPTSNKSSFYDTKNRDNVGFRNNGQRQNPYQNNQGNEMK